MTHCRWTDRIAETVADPAAGVDALTAEEHAHIGRCAECFATVERLIHLDRALNGELRSLERGDLPHSVLATPAYERRSRPPLLPVLLGGLAVATAMLLVVIGSGFVRGGLAWIGSTTASPAPIASNVPSVPASVEPSPLISPAGFVTQLEVGAIAAVVDEPLVVRTSPGATDGSTITDDRLWIGQRVRLLEGPVEADGYPWWRVRVGEIEGWIGSEEKDGSAPWISPMANGRIAYATDGRTNGFTSNPDGSEVRPLLPEPLLGGIDLVTNCAPRLTSTWSNDGSFLLLERVTTCGATIYRVSPDGSNLTTLGVGNAAALSPDGSKVAFEPDPEVIDSCRACAEGTWPIQIVSLASGEARSIDVGQARAGQKTPAWSPDGMSMAITEYPTTSDASPSRPTIVVGAIDSAESIRIAEGVQPTWSPDGRWIVYGRMNEEAGFMTLYRIRADGPGTEERIATGDPATVRFSPDGQQLAWSTPTMHGDFESWILPVEALDGLGAVGPGGITFARSSSPISIAWSPDGAQLAWSATTGEDAGPGIWVGNADGSGATRISDGDAPSWQPLLTDERLGRTDAGRDG